MKPLTGPRARSTRSGSALLLSFLVLIVLAAIIFQLYISTNTDARVARNDIALASMEQAIESALLEVYDRLESDAESSAGSTPAGDPAMGDLGGAPPGEEDPGAAEAQSVDSREDPWGRPQRTTINDIELRVLVQDEDSKLNVLGILAEDQEQADEHFERLVRVIDLCREDTREDLDRSEARRLAEELRTHMTERMSTVLPKPHLLSDDDENEDLGLLLTLRECVVLDEFHEGLFRDFRDETGTIVHSLGTFLTVWTSLATHEDFRPRAPRSRVSHRPSPPGERAAPGGRPAGGGRGGRSGRAGGCGARSRRPRLPGWRSTSTRLPWRCSRR